MQPIQTVEPEKSKGPGCAAEIEAFLQGLGERIEVSSFEIREFVAHGAEVMSFGSFAGTTRGSHRAVAADWAMQWRVEAGRLRLTKALVPSFAALAPEPRTAA